MSDRFKLNCLSCGSEFESPYKGRVDRLTRTFYVWFVGKDLAHEAPRLFCWSCQNKIISLRVKHKRDEDLALTEFVIGMTSYSDTKKSGLKLRQQIKGILKDSLEFERNRLQALTSRRRLPGWCKGLVRTHRKIKSDRLYMHRS